MSECLHCSSEVLVANEKFCCRGCEAVYQMIHDGGHSMFYDLKKGETLIPLRERPFQDRGWEWLDLKQQSCEAERGELTLGISGLTCVACVWLVEAVARETPGVLAANISITRGSIEIIFDTKQAKLSEFSDQLFKLGYEIIPTVNKAGASSPLGIQLGICGALAMNTMAFTLPRYTGMETSDELHELFSIIVVASSSFVFLIGGSYFFKRAWQGVRHKTIHMDLPISLGIILAYLGSWFGWLFTHESLFYFDFVAIFTFLMLLGKQVQHVTLSKANSKFSSENTIPESYLTEAGENVSTGDISPELRLIIPAGSVIPSASRLVSDDAECSLAWITGEPTSILYKKTDPLPAGAVNQSQQAICVETLEAVSTELFSEKLNQVEERQLPWLSRAIGIYLYSVIVVGLIAGIWWGVIQGQPIKAIQVAISIFVVSCPCGIGLALPLLDTRFHSLAGSIGVFPLTANCWSGFNKLKRVVFDKTGTLTLDRPALNSEEDLTELSELHQQVLFTLTKNSYHPLSRSLFSSLIKIGVAHALVDIVVEETAGVGVSLEYEGRQYSLQRPDTAGDCPSCDFLCNDQFLTKFTFSEKPREFAKNSLAELNKQLPHETVILSGDQPSSVAKMASSLGITKFYAALNPEEKYQHIKELEKQGGVFYIGDGINDIPAMRESTVSAAPFANLNLVTQDVDLVFTDETLVFLPKLLGLAKKRQKLFNQLIIYSVIYNIAVVAIACTGVMSPLIAAIIMPLSSLLSIFIVSRRC